MEGKYFSLLRYDKAVSRALIYKVALLKLLISRFLVFQQAWMVHAWMVHVSRLLTGTFIQD